MQIQTSNGYENIPNNSGSPTALNNYQVVDLLESTLSLIGIGVSGNLYAHPDITKANKFLNMMLAQWQQRGYMSPCRMDQYCLSSGNIKYLIGPGGDIDIPIRPTKVTACYVRLLFNNIPHTEDNAEYTAQFSDQFQNAGDKAGDIFIDYPLIQLSSYEEYSRIGLKQLITFPRWYFYNPTSPCGELFLYPVPMINYFQVHIVFPEFLPGNIQLDTQLNLPPEYWEAVVYSLAVRLAGVYGVTSPQMAEIIRIAENAQRTILASNLKIEESLLPACCASAGNNRATISSAGFYSGGWAT